MENFVLQPLQTFLLIGLRLGSHDLSLPSEVFNVVGNCLQDKCRRISRTYFQSGPRSNKANQTVEEWAGELDAHGPIAVEWLNSIEKFLVDVHVWFSGLRIIV